MELVNVVMAAIPGADQDVAEHVLWSRTSYPAGSVSAREVFDAASRLRRATANGLRLCDFCDRVAREGRWTCVQCHQALTVNRRGGSSR